MVSNTMDIFDDLRMKDLKFAAAAFRARLTEKVAAGDIMTEAEIEIELKQDREAELRDRIAATIPLKFQGGFETWKAYAPEHEKLLPAARRWVDDFYAGKVFRGLIFAGNVGCGKTHLACGILKATMERGFRRVKYQHFPELFMDIRSTWKSGWAGKTAESIIEDLLDSDLLLLDDFGAQRQEAVESDLTLILLDSADRCLKPTIMFTTNLTDQQIARTLGPANGARIISRMNELAKRVDAFPALDVRLIKKGER